MNKSFLKWVGGKSRIIDKIVSSFPTHRKVLIEPFVGSGTVALNSNFEHYSLNDINAQLVKTLELASTHPERLISDYNNIYNNTGIGSDEDKYYSVRNRLNSEADFLWINKNGFNGLLRYNKKWECNTPWGHKTAVKCPEKDILNFYEYFVQKSVSFSSSGYFEFLYVLIHQPQEYLSQCVIYCDPPYVDAFTGYGKYGFELSNQEELADMCQLLCNRGAAVIISNHATDYTRDLYSNCDIQEFPAYRSISRKGDERGAAMELIATFKQGGF